MRASGRGLVAAALLALLAADATAEGRIVRSFEVQTPRDFGYLIGDVISAEVRFELALPYRLVEENLPEPRRVDRFLLLDAPRLQTEATADGTRYRLVLDYRLVGAPDAVTYLETPAFTLDVSSELGTLALAVPAWRFSVGPMVVPEQPVAGSPVTLQPPLPPPALPVQGRLFTVGLLAAAALVALGFLGWMHLAVPWLARSNGPFARAARDLRRLRAHEGEDTRRLALARLHRAFDETAGHALFETGLPGFFRTHPGFAPLDEPIATFFVESRTVFYLPGGSESGHTLDLAALRRLCLACRDAERGVS